MSDNPTYPGVYIQELESSVHTIVGVSTSVTAFIGRASKGIRNNAVTIHSFEEYVRNFGDLSKYSEMSYAVYHYFLNGGKDAVIVAIDDGTDFAHYTRKWKNDFSAIDPPYKDNAIGFKAYSPGKDGRNIAVIVKKNELIEGDNTVNLEVRQYNPSKDSTIDDNWAKTSIVLESFYNLSISSAGPRYVYDVIEQMSNYIRKRVPTITPPSTILIDNFLGVYTPDEAEAALEPKKTTIAGEDDVASASVDSSGIKKGIYALDDVDIFNILCIPPFNTDADVPASVYTNALSYCKKRRAILIIDPPLSWNKTKDAAEIDKTTSGSNYLGSLRKENAAVFFPRIKAFDPKDGNRIRNFVPCGFIAGVIARTDSERGVWKAPAGIQATIFGANDLAVNLTDPENGELNPLGINCLRIKPPAGIVVWGARTLRGADALTDQWKYLPVRRLALYIEESLYRGTQWIVFEPNDEGLWSQIRLNIGSFMHDLFTKGAFQGSNPKEAYLVKCDSETTTQYDIDRGIVNIIVGFAPLKPAEFVMIKIKQLAGQTAMEGTA